MKNSTYKKELYGLQVELVKFQRYVIENELKVCLIFEGRDAAGKDGIIKRFTEHLSPREARAVALGKPSDREKKSWYFQRYVPHLPSGGEIVFFNRSWYNRAGVEPVMGFCTDEEHKLFLQEVGNFEQMLIHSKIIFFKYYLDITKDEQKKRFRARENDPLKQWKISPIDLRAQRLWKEYSQARDEMFVRTSFVYAPWYIVHSNNKKTARIQVMKHFLTHVHYPDKNSSLLVHDNSVICRFDPVCYEKKLIAK